MMKDLITYLLNKGELNSCINDTQKILISEYKSVPSKEPTYVIEMSAKEFQLVSFYLELERRKPIMNVKVDAKLKENKND